MPPEKKYTNWERSISHLTKRKTSVRQQAADCSPTLPIHLETLETNIEFKQSNRSAEFIRGEEEAEDKYIRQGQLLHNLFSVIRTTDDVPPAIERLRFEGIIESVQQEEQIRNSPNGL